ncbi:MAG: hypothetical protein WA989_18075, partial [Henriciella sp.]|uniref:hypothetical protein n=1 Tax=Henriciella sp. TaxID=1968823 RepID=UPI003C75E639
MTNSSIESDPNEPLLRRLRRMGLILTRDHKLADSILREAFLSANRAGNSTDRDYSELDLFELGFDAFDDAVHRKGAVITPTRAASNDGSLGNWVNQLTYVERVATSLLLVERMTPKQAAILSGRPPNILRVGLTKALQNCERN